MPNDYACDGCGKPFTIREWADRCTPHEPGCPNADDEAEYTDGCDCDLNYHAACCPECTEDESENDA